MTRIDNVLLHAALYLLVLRLAYDLSMLIYGIPNRWTWYKIHRQRTRDWKESLSK